MLPVWILPWIMIASSIVPSNFDTNDIATDVTNTFKANTEVFTSEAYLTKEYSELTSSSIKINLVPDPQTPNGEYIGEETDRFTKNGRCKMYFSI